MSDLQTRLRREGLIRTIVIIGSLVVLAGAIFLPKTPTALANTPDINNARSRYPKLVGSKIDSCSLCHTSSIPDLNPYGADYSGNGRSPAALAAIEGIDSDGDGFNNLTEINALTFPGNATDKPGTPTATLTPIQPATNTPTATRTSLPTATATTRPTATQVVPPTATQPAQATATPPAEPTMTQAPTIAPTLQCYKDDKDGKDKKYRKGFEGKKKYPCKPKDGRDREHDGDSKGDH